VPFLPETRTAQPPVFAMANAFSEIFAPAFASITAGAVTMPSGSTSSSSGSRAEPRPAATETFSVSPAASDVA
jgi:hypothetical protein